MQSIFFFVFVEHTGLGKWPTACRVHGFRVVFAVSVSVSVPLLIPLLRFVGFGCRSGSVGLKLLRLLCFYVL